MPRHNPQEIQHVVTGMQVTYEGIFDKNQLFKLINQFFQEKGYQSKVILDAEKITERHKSISVRIRPFKVSKAGNKKQIQVWIHITNLEEVIREVDDIKQKFNTGKINIVIDCFVEYDLRGRWESRAEYVFIRNIFEKFLYKSETKALESEVQADAVSLKDELYAFLNMSKFLFK